MKPGRRWMASASAPRWGSRQTPPGWIWPYKLVKYDGRPILKLSTGKVTLADEKQVYRLKDGDGMFAEDIIALRDEPSPNRSRNPC